MKKGEVYGWAIAYLLILTSCIKDEPKTDNISPDQPEMETETEKFDFARSETFTFSSDGIDVKGKIYFSDSNDAYNDLPTIYLLDYQEQHFTVTKDEAEQVIRGVRKIEGLDALVVTLDEHPNIDAHPNQFREYYDVFKDMASYVDVNYTNNASRTFIAKGSEAGIVLLALLSDDQVSSVFKNFIASDSPPSFNNAVMDMIRDNNVPEDLLDKKLHLSFSRSNDRNNNLALINSFEKAQYPWLKFESKEYTDTDFNNTYPLSFAAGLKFVFNE